MKEIIPFKKDIIFKTKIAKMNDISLTHDYKVLDSIIEGEFLLSGNYKMTEASVINEEFIYNIPFSIALSDRINKDTINLMLYDFKYEVKGDVLGLKAELEMDFEEKQEKEMLNDNSVEESIDDVLGGSRGFQEFKEMPKEFEINSMPENMNAMKEEKETKESIMSLTDKVKNSKETVSYKIYIVRENDNIESIASKYNISLNDLMDYNDINSVSIGDKIIIPYAQNE